MQGYIPVKVVSPPQAKISKVNIHRVVILIPAELTCSHFCTHVIKAPKQRETFCVWPCTPGGQKGCEHSTPQGARFGEHHMNGALGELYLSLHNVERSEAQSVGKMQSSYGQQRMSDYCQQSVYVKFISFQAWIEKSQFELQYVYKQATNRAFGTLHYFFLKYS